MLNRHLFIYSIAHGVPAIIGFVALVVYTHMVSPSEYGLYVIGQSIATMVSNAFFGWIRLSVARYQAGTEHLDLRGVVLVVYGASAALMIAVFGVMLSLGIQFNSITGAVIVIFALCLSSFEIMQELRRATFNPTAFTAVAVIRSIAALLLGIAALTYGMGGVGLLMAAAFSLFLANTPFCWQMWRAPPKFDDLQMVQRFLYYGGPLAISTIVFAAYGAVDRLAVSYLLGQESAGQYGVASDLARQAIGVIAASVGAAVSPIAFRTLANGPAATREHLNKSLELLFALVGPIAIWLATCSDVLAGSILGPQYVQAATVLLPILAAARLCGAATQYYVHISYQLAERPFLQLSNDTILLLCYLALMTPLTLGFGLKGAAAAALGSEFLGFAIGLALARRGFQLPFCIGRLFRIAISLTLLGFTLWIVKWFIGGSDWLRLSGATFAGAISYGIAVLLFDIGGFYKIARARFRLLGFSAYPGAGPAMPGREQR